MPGLTILFSDHIIFKNSNFDKINQLYHLRGKTEHLLKMIFYFYLPGLMVGLPPSNGLYRGRESRAAEGPASHGPCSPFSRETGVYSFPPSRSFSISYPPEWAQEFIGHINVHLDSWGWNYFIQCIVFFIHIFVHISWVMSEFCVFCDRCLSVSFRLCVTGDCGPPCA